MVHLQIWAVIYTGTWKHVFYSLLNASHANPNLNYKFLKWFSIISEYEKKVEQDNY